MSGLTPIPLLEFRRALGARGWSLCDLADAAQCSPQHLSRMLWGRDRRGGLTLFNRLRACVTPREWVLLLGLPHIREWNDAQSARGAMPWRVRWVCAECGATLGFVPAPTATLPGAARPGVCPDCVERLTRRTALWLVRTEAGLQMHAADARPACAVANEQGFTGVPSCDLPLDTCHFPRREAAAS
jgi:hypothetical protein